MPLDHRASERIPFWMSRCGNIWQAGRTFLAATQMFPFPSHPMQTQLGRASPQTRLYVTNSQLDACAGLKASPCDFPKVGCRLRFLSAAQA